MPELKLGKEVLSSSQIAPQLRLKQHQCMLSLFSSAFLFNFTPCFSSFLFHVHLHGCIHMCRCHLPCICLTSLLSLFLLSATCAQTAIPYLSLTLSRIYILFLFSHTLLILLFICPSVHIYLQTWHGTHKSPFQSAYFSHALEFFFLPPSVTLPSLTLCTITHSVFYCSTFIFKNASKFPSCWHCRPLSPMPSG